ncbi:MAG TPA: HAMP domain-containing protein [Chromatiales bacterium]|nr:HAMP domain-containing protein [Chromatiales bacterium]
MHLANEIQQSRGWLSRKFLLGGGALLLASLAVFVGLFAILYVGQLREERMRAARQVDQLLEAALVNAMRGQKFDDLRAILERLGAQPEVLQAYITDPQGRIRFASDPGLLDREVPVQAVSGAPSPPQSRFVEVGGRDVLRSIAPIRNRPACTQCHGSLDTHPINGILFVDRDALPIRARAFERTLWMLGVGLVLVGLLLATGLWALRRWVLAPVGILAQTAGRLSAGELQARSQLRTGDEFEVLSRTLDQMAASLQEKLTELERQRHFLQGLVDAIPDGIRVIGPDYRIRVANRAYCEHLDLDDCAAAVGNCCYASSHHRDEPCPPTLVTCPLHEVGRSGKPVKTLHEHVRADGSRLKVEVYAAPMPMDATGDGPLIVESIRDLERALAFSQEQRLTELGELAAGVAHEIGNPLASVQIALDAMESLLRGIQSEQTDQLQQYFNLVHGEVERCIDVSRRMLRLSAAPSEHPELVVLRDAVAETASLLLWEAEKRGIRVEQHLESADPVLASDAELRMVVLNLIQNAFHAMPEGGTLVLEVLREGDEVVLRVRDTGAGIAPDVLPRIFDPFFSKRADGVRGTGLGLAIVRSIVEKWGGRVSVDSRLGEGACFEIRLPAADGGSGDEHA